MKAHKSIKLATIIFSTAVIIAASIAGYRTTYGATVGQVLQNVTIQDANGKPSQIPQFGSKVISIFYNDANTADIGDPLADAIKAKNYPDQNYDGIGIANCKDSKGLPDWAIRAVLRMKIKKYKSTMLADVDHSIKNAWNLGDCNNTCVVLIIGRDRRVKYVTSIKSKEESKSKIPAVLALLDRMAK